MSKPSRVESFVYGGWHWFVGAGLSIILAIIGWSTSSDAAILWLFWALIWIVCGFVARSFFKQARRRGLNE